MARNMRSNQPSALEQQVSNVLAARSLADGPQDALLEREFAALMQLLAPRTRHLVQVYRLADIRDDAEQVCAIAVWRALQSYDPAKAGFSTHVTWQLRGELQSLRHRWRLDQRRSARTAGARTVALEALAEEGAQTFEIVDDAALKEAESAACEAMARRTLDTFLTELCSPEHERAIVFADMMDEEPALSGRNYTPEQRRQIVRRTYRNCAKLVTRVGRPAN